MPTKQKFKVDWGNVMNKIKEQSTPAKNSFKDERIYTPQFSDSGVAQAEIRFLPSPDTDVPFVSVYSHSFKNAGGWFIEHCPTTLKKECPVCKANGVLWEAGDETTARNRKRKLSYYSNILVITDKVHPENEGKVFLFKYGIKIYEKIMKKMNPGDDALDKPIMIFDWYEGANFKLIIEKKKVDKIDMPNYDSARFVDTPTPVGDEAKIEDIHKKLYPLKNYISDSNFKSYQDLETKFVKVVGQTSQPQAPVNPNPAPKQQNSAPTVTAPDKPESDDDFFTSLQDETEK